MEAKVWLKLLDILELKVHNQCMITQLERTLNQQIRLLLLCKCSDLDTYSSNLQDKTRTH
jgi:hypothetical protein